jgi:hypothetical protein
MKHSIDKSLDEMMSKINDVDVDQIIHLIEMRFRVSTKKRCSLSSKFFFERDIHHRFSLNKEDISRFFVIEIITTFDDDVFVDMSETQQMIDVRKNRLAGVH